MIYIDAVGDAGAATGVPRLVVNENRLRVWYEDETNLRLISAVKDGHLDLCTSGLWYQNFVL